MSSFRHNEKHQIRVPSKLVDSDYDTNITKNRKKSNNKVLNDEVGGNEGADYLGKNLGDEVRNVTLTRDKCNEVCEEVKNRGTRVNETNSDKETDLVQPTPDKNSVSEVPVNTVNFSYTKVLNKSLDNKLMLIPTEISTDGIEEVIFNDEIVKEGKKSKPTKLPLWVKFKKLPLEAWSTKGISAITSRLGKPLIMDQVTTNMCNMGNGRAGFARVLIKVEACKGLLDQIEIMYRNNENMEIERKFVKVEYDWKPSLCSFCLVFGHKNDNYGCRPKTMEEIEAANEELRKMKEAKRKEKEGKEEFVQVNRKKPPSAKQVVKKNRYMQGVKMDNVTYQPVKKKVNVEGSKGNSSVVHETEKVNNAVNESPSIRNKWNVNQSVMDSIRRSANKFFVLIDDPGEEGNDEDDNVVQNEEDDEGEVAPSSTDFMDVKIAAWNIRGLGKLSKHNAVKNLLNDEKLGIDDVASIGLHYTWTKSLLNSNSSSLKNIDRVMGNEEFFYAHRRAHVVFLPYGIFDHSQVVLTCSQAMKSPSRSFRFANYVTDKEEFKTLVKGNLNIKVEGFAMYKLVKKGTYNVREVTREEIKDAMYSIDDNKAPGPNGYNAKFFKKAWNIVGNDVCRAVEEFFLSVGNDVCRAVEEFFLSGKLLGELNATLITLVPKVSTPIKVTNFRPISCCNVAYKCISKIITNMIKNVLDTIVDKNQSAFIPKRHITDNILLTQELLKGYDYAKGPKRCSMKIDIQKAYDIVNWTFLKNALGMFGFYSKMVNWIVTCVCTPSYSICINGEIYGYFRAGSKDRPPMLAPGNFVQWKSRIKRYIDTKPNHELIYHCLKNPSYKFTWADMEVLISEGSPVTRTESQMETYKTVSQDIRDQLNAEAEAV
nr:RNA-directed DNA polymerase, eukaryota, reverse transcriptase zinc-binding domain protein [Tanacetum cinerariifolium]